MKLRGASQLASRIRTLYQAVPYVADRQATGKLLVDRIKRRFLKQHDENGKQWAAHSPATRKGRGILFKSGLLYRSIAVLPAGDRSGLGIGTGAGFRIGVASRGGGVGGTQTDPAIYGGFHQRGFTGRHGLHVKARRFLGIGKADVVSVTAHLRRRLKKAVDRSN